MKLIYIKESKVDVLKESEEELTFWRFFVEVKKFITDLLTDPIHARPSIVLVSHGLDNDFLRKKLQDDAVIIKSENIDEPYDEATGNKESRYYLSYKVPKKGFKKKLRRIYQKTVESNINEGIAGDATCDERMLAHVKNAVKAYNDKIINKKLNKNEKEI